GEVETLEYQRDRGMGVTVYRGKRKGSASTADLSERALEETVAKAYSIAGFTAEDDCAGPPDPDTIARDPPDLDLCHPWSIDPDEARELAVACEAAALNVDKRIEIGRASGRERVMKLIVRDCVFNVIIIISIKLVNYSVR